MKGKLLLCFALSILLINVFAFSMAATVSDADSADVGIFNRGAINGGGTANPQGMGEWTVTTYKVFKMVEDGTDEDGNVKYKRKEQTLTIERPVATGEIDRVDASDIKVPSGYTLVGDAGEIASGANSKMEEAYYGRDVGGEYYYIHEEIGNEQLAGLSGDRKLFVVGGGELQIVGFDKGDLDFYQRDVVEEVLDANRSEKYRAAAVYADGLNVQDNVSVGTVNPDSRNHFSGGLTFLLKTDKATCPMDGRNIATNSPECGDIDVTDYCEFDACGFIWNVAVAIETYNFDERPAYEGLSCKKMNVAGSEYCEIHKCANELCTKPIVGINLLDARYPYPALYQGEKDRGYSDYCEHHFCIHFQCKAPRITTTSATPLLDKATGIRYAFPEYCQLHGNDCALMSGIMPDTEEGVEWGCLVYDDSYTLTLKPLCMVAAVSNYKFKDDKYELLSDENDNFILIDEVENNRCAECNEYIMEISSINNKYCFNCGEAKGLKAKFTEFNKTTAYNMVHEKEEITYYEQAINRFDYSTDILELVEVVEKNIEEMREHGIQDCDSCMRLSIWVELDGTEYCSWCGKDQNGMIYQGAGESE